MKKALLSAVFLLASLSAQAEVVTVGQHNTANCYPFSCFASQSGTVFQQVYSSTKFSGAGTINSLSFFRDYSGLMDSATYTLRLSTTTQNLGFLDLGTPSNNLGADVSTFGTFTSSVIGCRSFSMSYAIDLYMCGLTAISPEATSSV